VVQHSAGAHGNDFALIRLLGGGTRQHDAACSLGFFFAAADYDAATQRTKLPCRSLLPECCPADECHRRVGKFRRPRFSPAMRSAEKRTVKMRQRPCGVGYMWAAKIDFKGQPAFFCS